MTLHFIKQGTGEIVPILKHVDAGRDPEGHWVDRFWLGDSVIVLRWMPKPDEDVCAENRLKYIAGEIAKQGLDLYINGDKAI